MRKFRMTAIGLAMIGLAACDRGKDANSLASDTSLSRDLNLANQVQPFQRLDSLSAMESGAPIGSAAETVPIAAAAPVMGSTASSAPSARSSSPSYPVSTRRRSTSSGRRTTASSGDVDVGTRSEGRVVVKKNTKRDAAIGAAAGAVLGAATSRNKVKGAVIGGVAGGVIGAIIGNNVDVQKKRVP